MSEFYSQLKVEIDAGGEVSALTFTANGEYLLSGGKEGVQVWRVKDGERVGTTQVKDAWSVAASKDGRWIASGSAGNVLVWDATNYEQVFAGYIGIWTICDVDFSADSSSLVSADGTNNTATIWDIVARKKVQTLDHGEFVLAAKYSPQGDRIATATERSVRVWDSDDGRLLVDVKAKVKPLRGLLWFDNHLFVKTKDSGIRRIDVSTGSTVSEWSVPDTDYLSSVALPQHGNFVAYSTRDNITFWNTSTHTQLGVIPRRGQSRSIAFSPDDRLLAMVAQERKIVIRTFSLVKEPDIRIQNVALNAWKHGQLNYAEALLTAAIPTSTDAAHHVLASRALVRARLQQWDAALVDAEESIKIQSSVVGYIAKCVILVCMGDTHTGCRVCDIASLRFHSDHVGILLLIKAVVLFMAGEHEDAISRIDDLITVRSLDPTFYIVQAHMHVSFGNLHMESGNYKRAIQSFEDARVKLANCAHSPPLIVSLISGWKFDDLTITIQQRLCEALLSAGRTKEAGESVLCMVDQETIMSEPIKTWVTDFMQRCLSTLEDYDNVISMTTGHNNISHPIMQLFREWVRLRLTTGTWQAALTAATGFTLPRFTIYQVICERLEITSHVVDAVSCFHQMFSELAQEIVGERANWILDFKSRCCGKLEQLGDSTVNAKEYDEAILQYTTALSLNPVALPNLLGKRSDAHAGKGEWEDALNDASEVIKLNPSSPLGYERKHAALHGMGCHDDATGAFEAMLSKMSESPDPEIREQSHRYVRPEKTKEIIRTTIGDTIRDSPLVLVDTVSGRLCNKSEQAAAFELTPAFARLISSTTTHIDHASIAEEVGGFYGYATFSHKWEENEPLFETVIRIVVYDLEASPTHEKLQMFCRIARKAGFNWAWSDTCCINKGDHFVLQEALVSMFKWYERSAMTIIFLRGVGRLAKRGALTRSIWNTRAWPLQEYHASKVVRFYTEDWTPYLGLEIFNHKESPEIISEMEEATDLSAQALMALCPGLDDIRAKLRLASTRQTTRVEDAAYSLLGIFSLSLPITYGEGDKALGRLLAQLLTSSGDVSILAWTGVSSSFNSCLPSSITVFHHPPTSHIPPAISDAEMGSITARLRLLNLTLFTRLYDRVNELPVPSFSGRRMKLPCLTFKLGQVSVSRNGSDRVFRAQTNALGIVEIQTREDLSRLGSLCLVYPWIDFLLNRQAVGSVPETITEENTDDESSVMGEFGPSNIASSTRKTQTAGLMSRLVRSFGSRSALDVLSLRPPSTLSPVEKQTHVLQFIARLRRPFGALLLTPTRQNVEEYRRVAAESLITVQVKEITPAILDKLMKGARMVDVL